MAEDKQGSSGSSSKSGSGTSTKDDPRLSPSVQAQTQSDDPKERAEAAGLNPDGVSAKGDGGVAQMQEAQDKIDAKGFIGAVPDPTPNENYAASNSTTENDLPPPETDPDLFDEARDAALGHPLKDIDTSSVERATGGDK
jgi:hypothetical protein